MSSNIMAILLIELSFITGGLCTVKSLKKRNDSLYEMSEALSFMSSEIETNLSNVFQIAEKLSASPSEIGCFFKIVYENRESIGEKTFSEMWRTSLFRLNNMPKECVRALETLGNSLGRYSYEDQLKAVSVCKNELDRIQLRLKSTFSDSRRLIMGISICAGTFTAILLL